MINHNNENIRIMVVEDDFLVREMLIGLLKELEYTFIGFAVNGYEALRLAAQLKPDIILMNIRMPQMDGIETAPKFAKVNPFPIVMITAYDDQELLDKASEAGSVPILLNPCSGGNWKGQLPFFWLVLKI